MKKFQLCLLVVILFAACARVQVQSDYNKEADFGQYQTFNFSPFKPSEEAPEVFNEINYNRLKESISEQMKARNYHLDPEPNLRISIYLKVKDKQRVVGGPSYYGGPNYYGHYSGYSYGSVQTVDYQEGTLIIDLVDTRTNQLVWQGVAKGTLAKKPKNVEERIHTVIGEIFEQYPYQAGETGRTYSKKTQ